MAAKEQLSKEEEKWQAENDARTLQDAVVIKKDPKRFKKAVEAAKRLAEEKMKEADAMAKIAQGKTVLTRN